MLRAGGQRQSALRVHLDFLAVHKEGDGTDDGIRRRPHPSSHKIAERRDLDERSRSCC